MPMSGGDSVPVRFFRLRSELVADVPAASDRGVRQPISSSLLNAMFARPAAEQWPVPGGCSSIVRLEATMGLLEIGVVLTCASAFGFYIAEPQE
ncbi:MULTISPECIES: hypothetical protein [Bosea]|jgi:hypothetical protein|uniref:hypothetical protein n=1 Tax=Bosea TaxID=85413 RepID=UPI000A907B14|nr:MULTISPECIES: hypothetical protein [Bosea]